MKVEGRDKHFGIVRPTVFLNVYRGFGPKLDVGCVFIADAVALLAPRQKICIRSNENQQETCCDIVLTLLFTFFKFQLRVTVTNLSV